MIHDNLGDFLDRVSRLDPELRENWVTKDPRVIILAANTDDPYSQHLGHPKQLLPVNGIPVITWTEQQVMNRGAFPTTLTNDPRVADAVVHSTPFKGSRSAVAGLEGVDLWSTKGRTIYLLGDTCYSSAAISQILAPSDTPWELFCRFGYNPDGSLGGGEGWAVSFSPEAHWGYRCVLEHLAHLHQLTGRTSHFWEQYRLMNGSPIDEHKVLPMARIIDDETEDFDSPKSYATWKSTWEAR